MSDSPSENHRGCLSVYLSVWDLSKKRSKVGSRGKYEMEIYSDYSAVKERGTLKERWSKGVREEDGNRRCRDRKKEKRKKERHEGQDIT